MSTPRELYNQVLKDEIDAFAVRMKQVIDDDESRLQAQEHLTVGLAEEIDRRHADQQVSQ